MIINSIIVFLPERLTFLTIIIIIIIILSACLVTT